MKGISPIKMGRIPRIILPLLGITIFIFLLSIFLFPEVSRNISRALSRLGIIPLPMEPIVPEKIGTFSIKKEHEEAEIDKPVKWREELAVINPSPEEVKGYEVIGLPKDVKNIVVKDEKGRILYTDKSSWETDIAGKEKISYFVEYETPPPYKEESEIKPFVLGEKYIKRIDVKSDFTGHYTGISIDPEIGLISHYENVKAYTDIPEELSEEDYVIRLYHVSGNSRLDVTNNPAYNVHLVDSDDNEVVDRVEWIVPQLSSQTFEVEASLTIINVQSYPTVGGDWTVRFNTTGTADLIITAVEETTFGESPPDDLKFLELRCGDLVLDTDYDGTSVVYKNYHCGETGYEISKVLTRGIHTLEFRFGDDVKYAHNQAEFFQIELQEITSVGSSWMPVSFTNTYEAPIVIATLEIGSGHDPDDTALSVRIRSVSSTGCEIKAMTPDYQYGSGTVPSNNIVYLMVVEEGYWDSITGFPKIEAGKFTTSTVVANNYGSTGDIVNLNAGWSGNAEFFSNVITDNDPGWIETWQSSVTSRLNPPTVTDFACSMSSAEVTPQDSHGTETIHWVVIQRGTGTFQGHNWESGRTADTIEEYTHNNLENHNLGTTPVWGVTDQLAMDGNNGGWANWEDDPFTSTQTEPYVQEDLWDSETQHTHEEVSYFVWDDIFSYSVNQPPTTPTNIQCNGNDNCDIDVDTGVTLQASGSTDLDGDTITYFIEALLEITKNSGDQEPGTKQLIASGGGTILGETGEVTISDGNNHVINFQNTYNSVPVVIAVPVTENAADNNYIIPVISGITTTQFNIKLCRDAGLTTCSAPAASETVNYFVFDVDAAQSYDWIEVGTIPVSTDGSDTILTFSQAFTNVPYVFATIQTDNDGGTAIAPTIWTDTATTTNVQLLGCAHPGTGNSCTGVGTETAGYVAIDPVLAGIDTIQLGSEDISNSLWTPITFSPFYTDPRIMVTQNDDDGGQDPQYPWARSLTTSGADIRYCEQDGANDCDTHTSEFVRWLALEQGDITIGGGVPDIEATTNWETYNNVFSSDIAVINSIEVMVSVSLYDNSGSIQNGNNNPDLELEMWDGTSFVPVGTFGVNSIGTFSITITNPSILTAWETAGNTDLRIRGINFDYSDPSNIDEIYYTDVFVSLDGKEWTEIGSHVEGSNFFWDTSTLEEQNCVNLRANATDPGGSGQFSDYYTKVCLGDCCLNITHGLPFEIKLPGIPPITSSQTEPGTATTPLEFNATAKTHYDVIPCVYGYGCNPGYIQDDTIPIFNFTNTGSTTEEWNISLSQVLPSYIHLYGNTVNSRVGETEITTSGWIAASNIPVGDSVQVWLWADFVDALPGRVDIAINHTSMSTT